MKEKHEANDAGVKKEYAGLIRKMAEEHEEHMMNVAHSYEYIHNMSEHVRTVSELSRKKLKYSESKLEIVLDSFTIKGDPNYHQSQLMQHVQLKLKEQLKKLEEVHDQEYE
jgi:hypothetical protein